MVKHGGYAILDTFPVTKTIYSYVIWSRRESEDPSTQHTYKNTLWIRCWWLPGGRWGDPGASHIIANEKQLGVLQSLHKVIICKRSTQRMLNKKLVYPSSLKRKKRKEKGKCIQNSCQFSPSFLCPGYSTQRNSCKDLERVKTAQLSFKLESAG